MSDYNYHRTYDPSTGRYLESDPIGLAAGLNTYSYVESMPTKYIDPFGLDRLPPSYVVSNPTYYHGPSGDFYDTTDRPRPQPGPGLWPDRDAYYASLFGEAGGAYHLMFVGHSASGGVAINTKGERCGVVTICERIGLGLYWGAGSTASVGFAKGEGFKQGTSYGLFLDVASGPAVGASVNGSSSGVSAGRAFFGTGGGFAVGGQRCHTGFVCPRAGVCSVNDQ